MLANLLAFTSQRDLSMQLRIIRETLIAAGLAATLALAACSNDDDHAGMPMDHSAASSAGSATAPPAGDFNHADVAFAQGMIPHHRQAIDMSDMTLAKEGVHPEVTALAEQIKAAQQPEIDTMNRWLDGWGRIQMDDGGRHHGGEGGIMTEAQMRQLDKANASDGQRLYLDGMIRHHQGAIHMAETEIEDGNNEDAIKLAKQIAETQQQEIETMQELLAKL
jgi:uncharacterized protein (DUF305 family)